ncbi:hypothetical protein NM208_g14537 [Fusarium decemcellulare]|uniref:Uncharacterized protein n=1 Tax=Fusarium decemcellulare TaxID=57161 RepID=A0ACC1RI99_9HYPO|nr:hypothetical protein NM208_g14537 [Fusarium decemcellulare]
MDQHGRLQPHSSDNEDNALQGRTDSSEDALASHPTQGSSSHPEHLAAFLEPGDIWYQFEVHRSSAEYHLNGYLNYLAQSREVLDDIPVASQGTVPISRPLSAVSFSSCLLLTRRVPTELSTRTRRPRNIILIQIKISRDTAIRDLLAMETVLAYAKNLRKPQKPTYSPVAAIW